MSDSYQFSTEVVESPDAAVPNADSTATGQAVNLQLADYDLQEKLGSGGYGEVWKAIGPGGLPKAVKILYGARDGQHAEAELKSLQRMRDLRHPFLLNIERIEVVDGRLIVVSELADGSLTDRFHECREQGLAGIPREELLTYLRDAADALDFMAEQHGLQHLDIKPDNLLLQGGHAKVGDFGLAKDLNARDVSAVCGFTPTFAAPELFEGRPDRSTDQYSLAIVYQIMLTSAPPFSGRTPAQLTAQHLRSQPDLSGLQPVDRPVVARALSKNVNSRFDNCRHFVDELARRKVSRHTNRAFLAVNASPDTEISGTVVSPVGNTDTVESKPTHESETVDYRTVDAKAHSHRRCVIIAAGGLGGEVIARLKSELAQRPDHSAEMLLVDTDADVIKRFRGEAGALTAEEAVVIPLRSSKHYRAARGLDLSWMSRRWLFNIPKSERVQNIRPLGRLALCDHRVDVRKKIADTLQEAQQHSEDAGFDVYVVASISGGTGSGIVSDLGLMVQSVIRESACKDTKVFGVLMHGTGSSRQVADVQEANTLATLKELRHLLTPGLQTKRGFDDSMVMRETAPFDDTYFVHLGDNISDVNLESRLKNVVEYLNACICSEAQADFCAWRTDSEESAASSTQLRMLGAGSQNAESYRAAADQSGPLVAGILSQWGSSNQTENTAAPMRLPEELADAKTLLTELHLTPEGSQERVVSMMRGSIGKQIESLSKEAFATVSSQFEIGAVTRQQLAESLGRMAGEQSRTADGTFLNLIHQAQTQLSKAATENERQIIRHLNRVLDTPLRFDGACQCAAWVHERLSETEAATKTQQAQMEQMFAQLADGSQSAEIRTSDDVQNFCREYAVLLTYQAIYQCYNRHLEKVLAGVAQWRSDLAELCDSLAAAAGEFIGDGGASKPPRVVLDALDRRLRQEAPTLLSRQMAQSDLSRLKHQLTSTTTNFLMAAMSSGGDNSGQADEAAFPATAWPLMRGVGGRRRVLGILPEGVSESEWRSTLRNEFGDCVAVRTEPRANVSVVCEIEGVPIESVLSRLTRTNPHIEEISQRVHTRVDIDW